MSVRPRTVRRGTVYVVRLRGPGGKVVNRTFARAADAHRFEATVLVARYRGGWIDPADRNRRFADVAEEWLTANVAKRGSTRARDRSALDNHVLPQFGDIKVGGIRRQDVRAAVTAWTEAMAPRSVERVFAVLRAVLNFAFEESEGAVRNPCSGVRLPRKPKPTTCRPTPTELAALAEVMPEKYEPMLWIAVVTGLRWGEVAGITMGQLSLVGRGTITVDRQIGRDEHSRPIVEAPKSEAGNRTVAIPDELRNLLAAHVARMGLTAADEDALVFTSPRGGPLWYGHWRTRVWAPAAIAAGFSREVPDERRPGETKPRLTLGFHDLRRANATEMVRLRVDMKTAQHRLGHADPRFTLALYAEATTEGDQEAADRVGTRFMAKRTVRSARCPA